MFGTPWPQAEDGQAWPALVADAVHAFDVLRHVLQRLHRPGAGQKARVDLDAMGIWSALHGLASILQADVMEHLQLAPMVPAQVQAHVMTMMGHALEAGLRR
jgi:hypothetical protein